MRSRRRSQPATGADLGTLLKIAVEIGKMREREDRLRRERDQARGERDELRSRIAQYTGEHPVGEDFGGARE